MKKRLIFSLLITLTLITISIVSAPTLRIDKDDYQTNLYNNFNSRPYKISKQNPEITRTFHITHDNGRSYIRTYENLNKQSKHHQITYKHPNRKNIYLNQFDYNNKAKTRSIEFFEHFKVEKETNCPEGWVCKKTTTY